jgi:8-oxo-dGTP diphosphatase
MTRLRAAAIVIQDDQIALIERCRQERHYFVFPGGGIEAHESPEEAVVREVEEELGLQVQVRQLALEVWYRQTPHYYYLVNVIGGQFGSGQGEEYTNPFNPWIGTYQPVWLPIRDLLAHPVLPSPVAAWVMTCHSGAWPSEPHRIVDPPAD